MKFIALLALPTLLATGALAGFLGECKFMAFSLGQDNQDPTFIYQCPMKDGASWPHVACSVVHLNDCFVNDRGDLRIRERGAFGKSCQDCKYNDENGVLSCACKDGAGGLKDTWIRVDQAARIGGRGKVHCYGILPGDTCSF